MWYFPSEFFDLETLWSLPTNTNTANTNTTNINTCTSTNKNIMYSPLRKMRLWVIFDLGLETVLSLPTNITDDIFIFSLLLYSLGPQSISISILVVNFLKSRETSIYRGVYLCHQWICICKSSLYICHTLPSTIYVSILILCQRIGSWPISANYSGWEVTWKL